MNKLWWLNRRFMSLYILTTKSANKITVQLFTSQSVSESKHTTIRLSWPVEERRKQNSVPTYKGRNCVEENYLTAIRRCIRQPHNKTIHGQLSAQCGAYIIRRASIRKSWPIPIPCKQQVAAPRWIRRWTTVAVRNGPLCTAAKMHWPTFSVGSCRASWPRWPSLV